MSRRSTSLLVPIIALAILFSAVAMWYDTLKIHAEIETGKVDVEITGSPWASEEYEWGKGWVASCSARLDELYNEDLDNPVANNDKDLVITIINAYPCYTCKVNGVSVKNVGTIPVKLAVEVEINGTRCELIYNTTTWRWEYNCDYDGNMLPEIKVYGSITSLVKGEDGQPVQLHPGSEKSFSVETHIEQDAKEGKTYVIQIHIKAIQWNEYPIATPIQ